MLNKAYLETIINDTILSNAPVSGGDISNAFKLKCGKKNLFLKSSNRPEAKKMFEVEAQSLKKLGSFDLLKIPEVIADGIHGQDAYIIMSFVDSKQANDSDMVAFGHKLALLHSNSKNEQFGLEFNNYIGNLPQRNVDRTMDWMAFYVEHRLMPQFIMAQNSRSIDPDKIPSPSKMEGFCQDIVGKVDATLLHGDLWSGNYLISKDGEPCLIDPAIYFGHNEVDLAMTKLFGGFSTKFYDAYHEIIPIHPSQQELTELYQLYYLLVHLNLFGRLYFRPVMQIVKKYFG